MKPDDPLLRILACPLDKGPLHLLTPTPATGDGDGEGDLEEALYNPRLRRRYPVLDGIPQLLPSSGEQVSEEEHERLLARVSEGGTGDPGSTGATP
ncbi:Trm112 family protein [Streptomyces sp. NPDC004051]